MLPSNKRPPKIRKLKETPGRVDSRVLLAASEKHPGGSRNFKKFLGWIDSRVLLTSSDVEVNIKYSRDKIMGLNPNFGS